MEKTAKINIGIAFFVFVGGICLLFFWMQDLPFEDMESSSALEFKSQTEDELSAETEFDDDMDEILASIDTLVEE